MVSRVCSLVLAGVMQMSRLRQGDPTVAAGSELDIIAAVVIRWRQFEWRRGKHSRIDDRRFDHGVSCEMAASR